MRGRGVQEKIKYQIIKTAPVDPPFNVLFDDARMQGQYTLQKTCPADAGSHAGASEALAPLSTALDVRDGPKALTTDPTSCPVDRRRPIDGTRPIDVVRSLARS